MDADAAMVGDAVMVGEEEQRDGYMLSCTAPAPLAAAVCEVIRARQ
jgi:hypothetical protein